MTSTSPQSEVAVVSMRGNASQSLPHLSDEDAVKAVRQRLAMSLANGVKIATIESSQAAHKTLARGDEGADVTLLQRDLVEAGYLTAAQASSSRASFDATTEGAVSVLQREHKMRINGAADWHTRRLLTRLTNASLARGDEGRSVLALQEVLIARGFLTEAQAATGRGVFGPRTEAAVRNAQMALDLAVSGVADVATRRALRRPE